MTTEILKADLSHLEFIINSQVTMAMETENFELSRKTVTAGVSALFEDSNKGRYFVAKINGELAGALLIVDEWSDWRCATVLWIHSVFVVKEHRKKGVYKSLYLHIKQMVENDNSFAGIRLYVDKTNKTATAVYRGLGMTDEHYNLFEWLK